MINVIYGRTGKNNNFQLNAKKIVFIVLIISSLLLLSSCEQINTLQKGMTDLNASLKTKSTALETKEKKDNKTENPDNEQADVTDDNQQSSKGQSTAQVNAFGKNSSTIRSLGGVSFLTKDSEPDIEMETGRSFEMPMNVIYKYGEFANIVGKSDETISAYFNPLDYTEFQIKEIDSYGLKYLLFVKDNYQFIVIRGTKNPKNAITDLMAVPWFDKQLKIWLHSGFRNASNALFEKLKTDGIDKNKKLIIVGHSLGGTIACILGIQLYRNGYTLDKIVTFGQPKFTDEKGAHKYRMLPIIRVVGCHDIVTILPPTTDVVVFCHLGLKVYIDSENVKYEKVGSAYNFKDDVVLPRNADFRLLLQAKAHLMNSYFGIMKPHMNKSIKIHFENKHNWLSKKPDPQT